MERKIQDTRYVVFLDIMGFKDRVARTSAEELYKELTEFNNDMKQIINHTPETSDKIDKYEGDSEDVSIEKLWGGERLMMAQFSDSIVLFSIDDSEESLKAISKTAGEILMSAINRDVPIPIKGALSKGYMTCDMDKQLFFGQALIDAYLLEENVQYYGVVVHHTAERDVAELKEYFRDTKTPLKSGCINHYELTWYKHDRKGAKNGLERIRLSVSDSPRKYVDNTKSIIESI